MKIFRVIRFFVNSVLGPKFAGELLLERDYNLLTPEQKSNVEVSELNTNFDLFGYGLIFYSTEIKFPETPPEETYDEMVCRALSMVDNSCGRKCECKCKCKCKE